MTTVNQALLVAAQHAALELEVVEAIALAGRFGQAHDGAAIAFTAAQDAFGVLQFFVVVAQWRQHFEADCLVGLPPWGPV